MAKLFILGNNWGNGSDGQGCLGCGPQEQLYACADVAVTSGVRTVEAVKTTTSLMMDFIFRETTSHGTPTSIETVKNHPKSATNEIKVLSTAVETKARLGKIYAFLLLGLCVLF